MKKISFRPVIISKRLQDIYIFFKRR